MRRSQKITLILFFGFFTFKTISAQNPGYMGKKFTLGYGLFANPAFNSIVLNYSHRPINILHEFFAEYAIGKQTSIGFAVQRYNYTCTNVDKAAVFTNSGSYWPAVIVAPEGSYEIMGINYKLYGKFYLAKYLAPWGKYFLLGLVMHRYTTSYDSTSMYVYADTYNNYNNYFYKATFNDWGPTHTSYSTVDVFFGFGNSRIFANKLVLDYGLSLGAIAALKTLYLFNRDFATLEDGIPANEYISKTSNKRVACVNRFNCYLKIGYLF